MPRTVMPASDARARLDATDPTDAQLERAQYEIERALRQKRDTFYLDLPITPQAEAHLTAQGYQLRVKHGRGPAHLQVRIP